MFILDIRQCLTNKKYFAVKQKRGNFGIKLLNYFRVPLVNCTGRIVMVWFVLVTVIFVHCLSCLFLSTCFFWVCRL